MSEDPRLFCTPEYQAQGTAIFCSFSIQNLIQIKLSALRAEFSDMMRALHNPHFWSILVIARSKATWQSCGLSTCFEIASLAQRRRLRRVSLAMTMLGFFKGSGLIASRFFSMPLISLGKHPESFNP